jgi:hypothetical protein
MADSDYRKAKIFFIFEKNLRYQDSANIKIKVPDIKSIEEN